MIRVSSQSFQPPGNQAVLKESNELQKRPVFYSEPLQGWFDRGIIL